MLACALTLFSGILACPFVAQGQPELGQEALQVAKNRIPANVGVDVNNGLDVVMGRAKCTREGQCAPCYECHQITGEGSVLAVFPRLTGQSYRYLYTSLRDFASGRRQNPTMTPIAQALTRKDMRDVAAFYSAQSSRTEASEAYAQEENSKAQAAVLAEGGMAAAVGLPDRGVQACENCHGPQGAGLPPVYPYLAGQYASYLESQLKAWQSGARKSDDPSFDVMQDIAERLTSGEIHAVAAYYASIRPPRILRDQNYAGEVEVGPPLGPSSKYGWADKANPGGSAVRQRGASGEPVPPEQKLGIPPSKIP
jgi:cytochrome c553